MDRNSNIVQVNARTERTYAWAALKAREMDPSVEISRNGVVVKFVFNRPGVAVTFYLTWLQYRTEVK